MQNSKGIFCKKYLAMAINGTIDHLLPQSMTKIFLKILIN